MKEDKWLMFLYLFYCQTGGDKRGEPDSDPRAEVSCFTSVIWDYGAVCVQSCKNCTSCFTCSGAENRHGCSGFMIQILVDFTLTLQ